MSGGHTVPNPPISDIPWFPSFETGNALLDCQHRKLLEDSKKLKEMVASEHPWSDLRRAVAVLVKDCTQHFRSEEAILRRSSFPRWAEHAAQHRQIEVMLEELSALAARVDGSDPQHRRMVASLEMTVIDIIVRHDLDYKSHLLNELGM